MAPHNNGQASFLHQKYAQRLSKDVHTTDHTRATPPPTVPHLDSSDALPPPHRERDDDQHKQPHRPPKRSPRHSKPLPLPPSTAPRPAPAHTSASTSVELDDDDDDETDDDDVAGHGQGEVEDVCLGCEGECVCGAAVAAPLLVPRAPIKVRITMSSLQASSAASTSHLPAPAPPPAPAPAPAPALSEWSEWSTVQKARSFSEEHEAYEDRPKKKPASHKKKGSAAAPARPSKPKAPVDPLAPPRKRGRPRKDRSLDPTAAPPRPPKAIAAGTSTVTPQRMSLRQVLAMSVRDAEIAEREQHSPAPPVFVPPPRFDFDKERLDDVSDLELELDSSGSGSEGENAIEQAEERALREEFEREQRRDADDDDDASTVGQDLSEFDDEDEGREAQARKAKGDSTREGSSFELTSEVDQDDPEAFGGGRGVVTWSDYGSVRDNSDAEMTQGDHDDPAGEFENELEELFALSEAVVGPVRDGEYELGFSNWFEEISNPGDDDEASSDEGSADGDDEAERADETIIIVDGTGWYHERRRTSGRESSDDSAEYDDDDAEGDDMDWSSDSDQDGSQGGDTTDSLDSDDHDGMVRFGIEVDSDSSSESESEYLHLPPGTASLADVQAPTLADLASLPQYLFATAASGVVDGVDVMLLDDALPDAVFEGVNRALLKGKGRATRHPDDETDDDEGQGQGTARRRSPAMGVFGATTDAKRTADLVVDESNTLAPSPFSKLKRKRRGRQLLDGTPSRRTRADSKVSTTSGPSVTDGSLSGEHADLASPFVPHDAILDFDLDDVLHASVLEAGGTASSSSSEGESGPPVGLSDLSRWNRIPIGAFRSSSSAAYQTAGTPRQEQQQRPLSLSVAASILRAQGATSSLSHTLSSPHTVTTTRRAIERRMLTSPVFGPTSSPAPLVPSPPKSHKARRKERKTTSSTSERVSGPKAELLHPPAATPSSLLLGTDDPSAHIFRPFSISR